jgi:hypothetical protein
LSIIEDLGLTVGDVLKEGFKRSDNGSGFGFQVYLDGHS